MLYSLKTQCGSRSIPILISFLSLLAVATTQSAMAQTGFDLLRVIRPHQQVYDLAVGPDGLLYAAVAHGIEVRKTTGELVREIQNSEIEAALQVDHFGPAALAFDGKGVLHALGGGYGLVARFEKGTLTSSFWVGDTPRYAYDFAVAADGSYFISAERTEDHTVSFVVQKHDAEGNLLFVIPQESISSDPTASFPALALSAQGDLHVLVRAETGVSVEVFSPTGLHLRRLQMPKGVDSDTLYNIFSDRQGNIVLNGRLRVGEAVLVTYSPTGSIIKMYIGERTSFVAGSIFPFEDLSGAAFDQAGNLYTSTQLSSEPILAYKPAQYDRIFFRRLPDKRTKDRAAEFTFATDRPADVFECSLDGSAFSVCSSTRRYSGLQRGTHVFRVRVRGEKRTTETNRWAVF
jgi:hypothetical protein